eukprot:4643724-Amphidinium_carterae.1
MHTSTKEDIRNNSIASWLHASSSHGGAEDSKHATVMLTSLLQLLDGTLGQGFPINRMCGHLHVHEAQF